MADYDIEDTEFPGAMKMRTVRAENTSNEDGFTPNDAGMNRFIFVSVEVIDGSEALATYDEAEQEINLLQPLDTGGYEEYPDPATVRLTAFGK